MKIKDRIKEVFGVDLDEGVAELLKRDLESKWTKREESRKELIESMSGMREMLSLDLVYDTKDVKDFERKFKSYFHSKKKQDNALTVIRDMQSRLDEKKSPQKRFRLKSLPTLERSSNGLDKGLYVFGADSNIGKTALLIQIAVDLLINNDNAKILFLTPDDSIRKITRRFISCISYLVTNGEYGVPIRFSENYYTKIDDLNHYQRDPKISETRDLSYQLFEQWLSDKRIELISGKIHMNDIESEFDDEKYNVLIADASYKIDCEGRNRAEKDETRPEELKNITVRYGLSSVCVKDGRKGSQRGASVKNTGERISGAMGKDDLRGSALWNYEPDYIANMWEDQGGVLFSIQKNKIDSMITTSRMVLFGEYSAYRETIN